MCWCQCGVIREDELGKFCLCSVQAEAKACLPLITETAMDGSAVVLTIHGHKQLMTLEDFSSLPVAGFAKLYTVGVCCLAFDAQLM